PGPDRGARRRSRADRREGAGDRLGRRRGAGQRAGRARGAAAAGADGAARHRRRQAARSAGDAGEGRHGRCAAAADAEQRAGDCAHRRSHAQRDAADRLRLRADARRRADARDAGGVRIQHARARSRRREGFVVVTGDIGTGKTTLCRALLEEIDRTTFTALVLNPFLTEEDLLKRILQDFGVVSREEAKAGRLANVTKQELIEALYDFLLSLIPLRASAVLIIDEAQNLPLPVLEQIRILSNLETDKEKLLQIILVGQLNLQTLLRSPQVRQLDQRVSIRYELKPLDADGVAAYVAHRLTIAGGRASVGFASNAVQK